MFLSERIDRAIERSTVLHNTQKRKISEAPYIVHPYAVAFLLAHFIDDEDVIIAGLMHDVLEDVPGYTKEMLASEFGSRVADIVSEVTEDRSEEERLDPELRRKGWRQVKEKYIENLKDDSREALLVAAADKIHNLRSLLNGLESNGKKILSAFSADLENMLWYYGSVVAVITDRLSHPLAAELVRVFDEFERQARKHVAEV